MQPENKMESSISNRYVNAFRVDQCRTRTRDTAVRRGDAWRLCRDWDRNWDIQGVLGFIKGRGLKVVALQFPDELLKDAVVVTRELQKLCLKESLGTQVCLQTHQGKVLPARE